MNRRGEEEGESILECLHLLGNEAGKVGIKPLNRGLVAQKELGFSIKTPRGPTIPILV